MKTAFAIFFALVLTASAFAQNSLDAAGAVKTLQKSYLSVVNGSAGAMTKGMGVCWDNTDDNGVTVDLCATEGAKPVGVVTDVSCGVGKRCLLQTKGYFAAGKFDYAATATTAGGMIYADVDGDLTAPATVTVAMFPLGVTYDAVSADSAVLEIYIDL